MSEFAALLPLLLPATAACLLPIAALDRDQASQKWIRGAMFLITLLALGASFYYLTKLWSAGLQPTYGQLRMDRLAQFAGIFVTVCGSLAALQCWDHLHQEGFFKGETLSLLLFSVTGMMLFASTTNLLVMFLGLELLSLPLYALTATVRERPEAVEGGMKYFITGAVAAACFLMGSVLLYGLTGSLDLNGIGAQALAMTSASGAVDPLLLAGSALLLMGFLFKVSAAPFHQWTPDAYEGAPHPIAGFMSVATKGVAIIALLRAFPVALGQVPVLGAKAQAALAVLAALTMVVGNLTALSQNSVKRMLAYSSISHAGYLLLGFVAGTDRAYSAMLFYLVVYLAMNMGAFGLLTALGLVGDRTTYADLRGAGWKRPSLGIAAGLCFLSLAGIPPTGGFYGKYMLFKELIGTGHVALAILGVLASLVSVYYYLRVLVALFLEKPTERQERDDAERPAVEAPLAGATVLVCAVLVLAGGFVQGPLMDKFVQPAMESARAFLR
ncbi:MAG: NADH-quinone oxidoreductase subunit N [Holophagaceae bacterium]|nr:NADH-quinone oxidoreductase subunit N [Holophagaceae bacterium]